jgi:hypothetical protein
MSREYNHQQTFVLKYQISNNLAFDTNPPGYLNADLRGSGWSLLRLTLSRSADTIFLDESRIFESEMSSRILLTESLNSLVGDELIVNNITPEQLQLNLVERYAKKVPIVLDGEITLNSQYQLKEPLRFEPDSVTIFGAEDQLTRLDFWPTNEFNRNDVEQDFQESLSLRNASPSITTDIFQTTLVVRVDQVTEKEIYVPILIPDSLAGKIRIFPSEVLVKVNLGLSQYEEVNSDDFTVELKWEPEQKNTREVEVTTLPDFVVYITHTPRSVDFYRSKSSENDD